jgi:predicted CoA-substrate-specific enzyme activase
MNFLGIDIGAVSAKAVFLKDNGMYSYEVMDTGSNIELIADRVVKRVLEKAKIAFDDVKGIVATGYGRISVPFADKKVTEITCHARGVYHLIPKVRTIIDIGGQDSKGMRVDETGNVIDFVMNDKCAAGTGRFLEVMAKALELKVDDLGLISLESRNPCRISSVCTVFAESEVVSLRAEGKAREDIIAGIHKSIASRIGAMMSQVGHEWVTVLTGGVAKNRGVIKELEDELKITMSTPENPQITGALGAALIASDGIRK